MPQPMSTPTAEGMTAPWVGMTDPTVAPIPTWASGMSATWPATIGSRAVFSAWRIVSGSISLAHDRSFGLMVWGMITSSFDCYPMSAGLVWPKGLEPSSPGWRPGILFL